uniref:Protein GLUTAMINE DUMPER 4 n=1 Tax=Noccaea caerulescens TaxID=107243 RepID=A0A1J3K0J4_NOCCA
MRPLSIKSTSIDLARHATSGKSFGNHRPPQSPWHSPVPYLYGGLAAMLGLIAFALLILACSYWRLSTSGDESGEGNGRGGDEEKESRSGGKAANAAYEEKILVIMAGDNLPRFLATPAANKCVCGHEGKMVITKDDGGGVDGEDKMGEREKAKENEETTSH